MRPPARSRGHLFATTLGALAAVLGWVLVTTPASAVPTCAFDPNIATATVLVGEGESVVIGRSGESITLDGSPCDVATVTNTDMIVVDGSAGTPTQITIDVSGGEFGPGQTPEADGGSSEIEFTLTLPNGTPIVRVVGGTGTDQFTLGTAGINLNAGESSGDADVSIAGSPQVTLDGEGGNDVLSVAGGGGTGAPAVGTMRGGGEADLLLAGLGGSTIDGGEGSDTADYSAATQISATLANGVVNHVGGQADQLSGLENLTGSPGADEIFGDAGPNMLRGGDGGDLLIGGGGDDTLDGGDGIDTLAFGSVDDGVTVDLRSGTAEGEGVDSLSGFENVIGTVQADTIHGENGPNLVVGGRGSDEIFGHDGTDDLRGSAGNDQLFGQKGPDRLSGGPGRDQLDGGQAIDFCRGGPDPDAFVFCERIVLD